MEDDDEFAGMAGMRNDQTGDLVAIGFLEMTDATQRFILESYGEYANGGGTGKDIIMQEDMAGREAVRSNPDSPPDLIEMTYTRWLYLFKTPPEDVPEHIYPRVRWTCELRYHDARDQPPARTVIGYGNTPAAAYCFACGVVYMMVQFAAYVESQGLDPYLESYDAPIMRQITAQFWKEQGLEREEVVIPYMMNMGGEVAKS